MIKSPLQSDILKLHGINVINWLDLKNKNNIEEICPCILFIPIESEMIGHYIALFFHNDILNYWCSYGFDIPTTVNKSYYLRNTQVNDEDYLNILLDRYLSKGGKMIINNHRFQSIYDTATCGRFAYIRIMKKNLSNDDFVKWFRFNNINNEELICLITYLLR